ncbi:hypothetical protein X735_15225 [Mesorhizobium sp. L2C085B000]|uniref:hypothetical protein n=2 Tax=unclassified Mesorhizobium TaxID=325217 RepID=UPI0003CFEF0B|nr:hypothetical protein [Mesorhizobium sp. L2C085B000]ESZ14946.1 hypothetical protein X735_15225 [Mesorhizobium sp. L2C085B000]
MGKDRECGQISAFDFAMVRQAFRQSVWEQGIAEGRWPDHAKRLFQQLTDEDPDDDMIGHIIAR